MGQLVDCNFDLRLEVLEVIAKLSHFFEHVIQIPCQFPQFTGHILTRAGRTIPTL